MKKKKDTKKQQKKQGRYVLCIYAHHSWLDEKKEKDPYFIKILK